MPKTLARINLLLNVLAVASAVTMTVLVLRSLQRPSLQTVAPEIVSRMIDLGVQVGPPGAEDTVIVLEDFECGFCKEFSEGPLRELRASSNRLLIVYGH